MRYILLKSGTFKKGLHYLFLLREKYTVKREIMETFKENARKYKTRVLHSRAIECKM